MTRSIPGARMSRQLLRFASVGVVSTLAYVALYNLLRIGATPAAANAIALVVTAVGNTAANRHWTFEVRGADRLARDHAGGLLAFLVALAITSASIAALGIVAPEAGRLAEVVVLLAANAAATAVRFVLLRTWILADRAVPVSREMDGSLR
jgi:putative flippase GtrA